MSYSDKQFPEQWLFKNNLTDWYLTLDPLDHIQL